MVLLSLLDLINTETRDSIETKKNTPFGQRKDFVLFMSNYSPMAFQTLLVLLNHRTCFIL